MRRFCALLVALLALLLSAQAAPGSGISRELARERAARIRGLRLELAFSLPEARSAPVRGEVELRFRLADASEDLVLDFAGGAAAVQALTVDGHPVAWRAEPGHLRIPASALRPGETRVACRFTAGEGPLNRREDLLYTLFVPARAREAFPCFDQPDLKARVRLRLELPASWRAVANGAEEAREARGGRALVRFRETEPLPSYLVAFAAGRFQVETAVRDGRTLRLFHREADAAKLARNRDAIFDLHAGALAWMERSTGIPYPFGKFDLVLIPAFQFGGMEHPGAVLYKEASLMLDASATEADRLARAELIAHETSHMWFGDLVTMRWFDDVWMKEVFAGFMAAKITEPAFPGVDHRLRFLADTYPRAYRVDRGPGANAIRQPLADLDEAGSLYGPIIYAKAPIVMRHLEALMGEAALQKGLRAYLGKHRYGNAAWPELIAALQPFAKDDLRAWSRVWVEREGRPAVRTELRLRKGRIARLAFVQRDPAGRGLRWNQRLRVLLGWADGTHRTLDVALRGARAEVEAAKGLPAPAYVLPTGEGFAYGAFALDPASLAWLSRHLPELPDALTRASAWITLRECLLDGALAPEPLLELVLAALPRERDEQGRELLLAGLRELFWEHLPDAARAALAPRVERCLREGVLGGGTPSARAGFLRAFRAVATTPEALAWMEALWARKDAVPGLPLGERDESALAQELALRGVPGWKGLLEAQLARIQDADRRAEFAFLMPSLDADPAVRRAFFARLEDPSQRRREPWACAGLRLLNHPLRAASALPDLGRGLGLLREIQRTGDIFFPQNWAGALLGGHASREAQACVEAFLAGLPADYPPRLRKHVEVELDRLRRCWRLRGR